MKTIKQLICGVVASFGFVAGAAAQSYAITWHTIDGGGGTSTGNVTTIFNPLTDGDPGAIVVITHNWTADTNAVSKYNTTPVGVYYTGTRWAIFNEDFSNMGLGRAFNVLVVKP